MEKDFKDCLSSFVKVSSLIVLITLIIAVLFIYGAAKTFHLIDSYKPIELYEKKFIDYDPFGFDPDSGIKSIKEKRLNGFINGDSWHTQFWEDGKKVYDLYPQLSPLKSRINLFNNEKAKAHLIVAGDSQTFGTGVKEGLIYSHLLAKKYDDINVYNLGHVAWSPASTYAVVDKRNGVDLKKYFPEEKGIFLYLMFPYLTSRDFGTTDTIAFTSGYLTHLERKGDSLITHGIFKDSNKFEYNLKKLLSYFDLASFYEGTIVPLFYEEDGDEIRRKTYDFTAFIFSKMKEKYVERYPQGKFYVALCDSLNEDSDKLLKSFIEKYSLAAIDLSDQPVCNSLKPFSYGDNHLNNMGHEKISELIEHRVIKPNLSFLVGE